MSQVGNARNQWNPALQSVRVPRLFRHWPTRLPVPWFFSLTVSKHHYLPLHPTGKALRCSWGTES